LSFEVLFSLFGKDFANLGKCNCSSICL